MHELSIVEGVVRRIEAERRRRRFARVTSVDLVCGRYNCLSEETLRLCFEEATKASWMEGARLTLTRMADRCRCTACAAEFDAAGAEQCPSCGSAASEPVIDRAVYIRALEVE